MRHFQICTKVMGIYIFTEYTSFVGMALSKRRAHEKKLWSHLNERLSRVGEMTIIQWKFINFMTRKIRLNFSFTTNSSRSLSLTLIVCLLAHEMMQIFITATHSHNVKSLLFRRPPVQKFNTFHSSARGNNKCLVVIKHDRARQVYFYYILINLNIFYSYFLFIKTNYHFNALFASFVQSF